jgi:hypothetical protein
MLIFLPCTGSSPPDSGGWFIGGDATCVDGSVNVVDGNLEFQQGGTLDLTNIMLDVDGELVFDSDNMLAMEDSNVSLT